jgi:thiol-disulfide isomerase/thioredoxin
MRHRFWSWSVALASTLTTSGMIALPTDRIWAQETEKGSEATKAEAPEKYDSAAFRKLLQTQKIDEAAAMIDAELLKSPNDVRLWQDNVSLMSFQLRSNRQAAIQRGQKLLTSLEALESLQGQQAIIYLNLLNYMGTASPDVEANLAAIDKALPKFEGTPYADSARSMKVQLLLRVGRADDAKSLLETALAAAGESKDYLTHANIFLTALARQFKDEAAKVEAKAMTIANKLVEGETVDRANFMVYHMFMQGMASRNMRNQPEKSLEYIAAIEAVLEKAQKDDTGANSPYKSVAQNLDRLKASITKELERSKLIGQPAKDYGDFAEYNHLIGMEDKSLADFKGNVVLLDFWAVWCKPCIDTFPHLKEWHEKYSEKGLVIIGSTTYYNYAWNDETGKASRSTEEVAAVDELKMLEKFRESYGLHHGFLVSDKKVNYGQYFMVSGIPQAVLIDKEGKIQMIRIGSGEQNAHDLQEKIEELLAQ